MENEVTSPRQSASGGARFAAILFVAAPLVGEFLLGNLPITWLWTLLVLAPMYGGGAILIRETARRFDLGWPGILILGLAYAVVEEAFVTQSLFNPDYVGLRLLDYGYLTSLGMGSWWTVYVLGIHTIWSTAIPIALVEGYSGPLRRRLWLGKWGLAMAAAFFLLGCVASGVASQGAVDFRASTGQLIASALAVAGLAVAAFAFRRSRVRALRQKRAGASCPGRCGLLLTGLGLGSVFMLLGYFSSDYVPAPVGVGSMLAVLVLGWVLLAHWSRSAEWSARRELAFASGVLATYVWFGFLQSPSVGEVSEVVDAVGNGLFGSLAIAFSALAWRRVKEARGD